LNDAEGVKNLIAETMDLKGLNVTIPFKESIIGFLDEIDSEANEIGAVNCIRIEKSLTRGFNTDAYGFSQSIKPFLASEHQRALILGTGGASKAVAHVLKKIGVDVWFVTSSGKQGKNVISYEMINSVIMKSFKLIVNTTPLGSFSDNESSPPLPYHLFTPEHLAYDLVYNPSETVFLGKAKANGAIIVNGLSMLQLQAEKSWEIWNS
jgi:shikimate dehydrogenase